MKCLSTLIIALGLATGEAARQNLVAAQVYRDSGTYSIIKDGKARKGKPLDRISAGESIRVDKGGRVIVLLAQSGGRFVIAGGSEVRVTAKALVPIRGVKPQRLSTAPQTAVLIRDDRPTRATATTVRADEEGLHPRGAIDFSSAMFTWTPVPDTATYAVTATKVRGSTVRTLANVTAEKPLRCEISSATLSGDGWWKIVVDARRSADAEPTTRQTYIRFLTARERAEYRRCEAEIQSWSPGTARIMALADLYERFDLIDLAQDAYQALLKANPQDEWLKQRVKVLRAWPGTDLSGAQ